MKKIILLFATIIFTATHGQNLSRVQKVNGIEVYVMSEPTNSYEVVYGNGNTIKWSSFITGGLLNESISTKITSFVNNTKKEAEKEGVQMDAIVYTNGKKVVGVNFTGQKDDRTAEVQVMNGIPVYIMCEPVKKYTVVTKEGPGLKWKSFLTLGLVNNSVEQDISKYLNKLEKDFRKGKVDALLYSSGKKAVGIKFTE
ncbi:hypothetical protein [Flagellimonas marina]|uniref:DUF4923 domain-containing protein n=1 Tax=Flagellimonas marina TaxID=1775168 RepID=A0ABV8PJH6_9FLAO